MHLTVTYFEKCCRKFILEPRLFRVYEEKIVRVATEAGGPILIVRTRSLLLSRFSMIVPSEIERMSVEERLEAIELLWNSIARLGESVVSPAWHGEVLSARRAKVEAGEGQFLSLAELRERVKRVP